MDVEEGNNDSDAMDVDADLGTLFFQLGYLKAVITQLQIDRRI